jgi:hypothetical protein
MRAAIAQHQAGADVLRLAQVRQFSTKRFFHVPRQALKFVSSTTQHLQMTTFAANNSLSATRHRNRAKCFVSPMRFGSGSRSGFRP